MGDPPVVHQAAALLERILDQGLSAAQVLDARFRQDRPGAAQRAQLAGVVYAVLRHRRRLAWHLTADAADEPGITALALARAAMDHPNPAALPDPPTTAQRHSLPDWLWAALGEQWPEGEAEALAAALNQPATVDLRVNRRKSTREQALAALHAAGIPARPIPFAPDGLRMDGRQPLGGLEIFRRGHLEVQDEGSQLIGHLLDPQPGQTVVDLCAGGGGKSLHLAALMGGRGRIVAADIDSRRLNRIRARLKRGGVTMVRLLPIRHERDPKLKPLTGKADAVLVDAPCSGTGTLRRRPEIKWQLQPEQVAVFHQRQSALLAAGAALTRPGGVLLYATCSWLKQENQDVVHGFLEENQSFTLQPALPFLARLGIEGLPGEQTFLNLHPHLTGTDGFFAARLLRRD